MNACQPHACQKSERGEAAIPRDSNGRHIRTPRRDCQHDGRRRTANGTEASAFIATCTARAARASIETRVRAREGCGLPQLKQRWACALVYGHAALQRDVWWCPCPPCPALVPVRGHVAASQAHGPIRCIAFHCMRHASTRMPAPRCASRLTVRNTDDARTRTGGLSYGRRRKQRVT